ASCRGSAGARERQTAAGGARRARRRGNWASRRATPGIKTSGREKDDDNDVEQRAAGPQDAGQPDRPARHAAGGPVREPERGGRRRGTSRRGGGRARGGPGRAQRGAEEPRGAGQAARRPAAGPFHPSDGHASDGAELEGATGQGLVLVGREGAVRGGRLPGWPPSARRGGRGGGEAGAGSGARGGGGGGTAPR